MRKIKRVISLKEVAEEYEDMADLARIFCHNVIEDDQGVWRFRENSLMRKVLDGGLKYHQPAEWKGPNYNKIIDDVGLDLNHLAIDVHMNKFTLEEYMKFYMQIGYSLSGYCEVFGQQEITDYGMEYLEEPPDDFDFDEEYYQTPIEYMREKYKTGIFCMV